LLRFFYTLCFMNLYLMSMVLVLVPSIAHAYLLQSKGEESGFLRAGHKVNWSDNENTFALYDNLNLNSIDKNQILFPKSKFYVSADLISVAFPMSIVFYSHISTENALADLLYANLKLKKLIEEYEDIQKVSKKLIWNSQYLFQQRDNAGSIYQNTRRLKESSIQTTEESSVFLNIQTHPLVSNQPNSLRPFFGGNNRFIPKTESVAIQTHENSTQVQNKTFENEDKLVKGNNNSKGSDSVFVKIFVFLANIISYCIANKGEAFFYGMIMSFLFIFFSSLFKK
jgi:hypothetical protein